MSDQQYQTDPALLVTLIHRSMQPLLTVGLLIACQNAAGKLDVLINNAGVNTRKKVLEGSKEDFMFVMDTNVHSALHLCRLCYPYLKESSSASIIFNSSVAGGPTALKSGVVYAMTKGLPASSEL